MSTCVGNEALEQVSRALAPEYQILREIGHGGMGVVYLARETALHRDVAVKVLPPNQGREPTLAERFLGEARTAARLDHTHIVPIFQVGRRDDLVFFTMKHVTGPSLRSLLNERGALAFDDVHRILRACAEALAFAHRCGVVHRDVKPSNILLDGDGRVFVTDFGIAKAIAEDTPVSGSGGILGTPHYLAPELCRGGRAGALTDQYALGVVAYEMLTGRLPFDGDTLHALVAQRLFGDPVPLRKVRLDLPAVLEVAVERAMRRDPVARFVSLLEMAELLGTEPPRERASFGVDAAEPEEDRPTVQLNAPTRPVKRARTPVTVALAVAAMAWLSLWPSRGDGWRAGIGVGGDVSTTRNPMPTLPAIVVTAVAAEVPELDSEPARSKPGAVTETAPTTTSTEPVPTGTPPRTVANEPSTKPSRIAKGARAPSPEQLQPIRRHLEEGNLWAELGRYQDALEQFKRGLHLVTEASRLYGTAATLDSLDVFLRSALERARLACLSAGQGDCIAATD